MTGFCNCIIDQQVGPYIPQVSVKIVPASDQEEYEKAEMKGHIINQKQLTEKYFPHILGMYAADLKVKSKEISQQEQEKSQQKFTSLFAKMEEKIKNVREEEQQIFEKNLQQIQMENSKKESTMLKIIETQERTLHRLEEIVISSQAVIKDYQTQFQNFKALVFLINSEKEELEEKFQDLKNKNTS